MSHTYNTLNSFKENIINTGWFAISPFKFMYDTFTTRSGGDYGWVITGAFQALTFLASPLIIVGGIITLALGIVAAAVQLAVLPIQIFFSGLVDLFSHHQDVTPTPTQNPTFAEQVTVTNNVTPPGHFGPLFTNQDRNVVAPVIEEQETIRISI